MNDSSVLCPSCGKIIAPKGAAFCPYCGARLANPSLSAQPEEPEQVEQLLKQYAALTDPFKKQDFLKDALSHYPDSLRLNEEKLFLGRLGLHDRRKVDFSCIKCWILHLYLTPGDLSPEKQVELRQELYHHPDLERCLSLTANLDTWMQHYFSRLCDEFITLFLRGSNVYNRTFLGFHIDNHPEKRMAAPVFEMMKNIYSDEQAEEQDRTWLYHALWNSFRHSFGDTSYLDAELSQAQLPIPC